MATAVLVLVLVLVAACSQSGPGASGTTVGTTPVAQAAQAVEGQFVQVVKDIAPSVVMITTDQGLGSGIVFDTKGDTVTKPGQTVRVAVTDPDGTTRTVQATLGRYPG